MIQKDGTRQAQGNKSNRRESLKTTCAIPNTGRICLVFVSADFREHAMGYNFKGFFQKINREKFNLIAVSLKKVEASPMQQLFREIFNQFYDVDEMSDLEIVNLVRRLNCDIAVDMMGDTHMNRQNLFAAGLAPIQVNQFSWISEPGIYDYMISDYVTTPGKYKEFYSEKIIRVPGTLFAFDDERKVKLEPFSRAEMGLPRDAFIYCAFNNAFKINPKAFAAWMRILKEVPQGILWLRAYNSLTEINLRKEATKQGVDPNRLYFAPREEDHQKHISRQQAADVFLDTFPFNAQTTATDALLAGLPVLTCPGEGPMSRIAASILNAADLSELVCDSLESYVKLAVALSNDHQKIIDLKQRIIESKQKSRFFNTAYYTQTMESAYIAMERRSKLGLPPVDIDL